MNDVAITDQHEHPAQPELGADQHEPVLDHRELGRDMRIFESSPLVGPGLPLWLPAGAAVRYELEQYAREVALRTGCEPVYSPVLGKRSLFERSGHWAKFADDMFPPMAVSDSDVDPLVLRPANCPHHAQIYAAEPRSYRDLPVRYSELAPMFRAERSGVLSGLSRVRQINLDDAHVFCRPDQVADEVHVALAAVLEVLDTLGIEVSYLRLSGRDDSRQVARRARAVGSGGGGAPGGAGAPRGRAGLARRGGGGRVLRAQDRRPGARRARARGDPRDRAARLQPAGAVRPDLRRGVGRAGAGVMIHRGTVGAMERMVAFLLERHAGRLPFWLAPVQVCLLPVGGSGVDGGAGAGGSVDGGAVDQVDELAADLRARGLRVRVERDGSLGNRIRLARRRRDALLGVLGPREIEAGVLAVTDPASGVKIFRAALRAGGQAGGGGAEAGGAGEVVRGLDGLDQRCRA